jgi:nitroreductase
MSDTGNTVVQLERDSVETALELAVRAPSIHNTQPWHWRLGADGLDLRADRSRQLAVADPDGHSLLLSCGAALHLTELGLRAAGWQLQVVILPDVNDPDLLARLRPTGRTEPDEKLGERADAALRRRSDRRPFRPDAVTAAEQDRLRAVARDAVAWIDFPDHPDRHVELAVAVSWADRVERNDEAYIAEMQRWLRDPDVHALRDGVPVAAIPHVPAGAPRHTDVPLRDFEVGVTGGQLITQGVDERPLIGVIFTRSDLPVDHLHAGISMMRMMIEAELAGLATCPLSQAVDFAAFRTRLQGRMGWIDYPQMMLRIGHPSGPVTELPLTPRRPPSAVLEVD